MKLLDDPKIPIARWNPQRPNHSHKPLDVADKMGLKPARPYCMRCRHHHLSAAPTNLDPKNGERSPKQGTEPSHWRGPRSTAPPWSKGHIDGWSAAALTGGRWDPKRLGRPYLHVAFHGECWTTTKNTFQQR
jgi:hypothetical protein